jgi:hypothetical protein
MQKTETRIADIKRRQAGHRQSQHGHLGHRIFALGDDIYLEKISYRAFQRRYGKSVGRKAPGSFVQLLPPGWKCRRPHQRIPDPLDQTPSDLPLRVCRQKTSIPTLASLSVWG